MQTDDLQQEIEGSRIAAKNVDQNTIWNKAQEEGLDQIEQVVQRSKSYNPTSSVDDEGGPSLQELADPLHFWQNNLSPLVEEGQTESCFPPSAHSEWNHSVC